MANVSHAPGFLINRFFLRRFICFLNAAGKKKKEQHDANQAGMGLNPAYAGAYGAMPPVSMISALKKSLCSICFKCIISLNLVICV